MAATITPPQMSETEMLQRFLNPTEPDYSDAVHLTMEQMEQMSSPPVTPKADPRQEELHLVEEKVTPNEEKLCWKCSKCWRRRMQASSHVTGQALREDHWMCLAIGEPVSLGSQVITDCSLFESRFPEEKSYQDSAINRMNKVTAQKISEESIIGDLQDNAIQELTKIAKRLMDYGLALNSDQVAYLQAAALFGAHYDEGEQLDVDEVNKLRDLILDECRKIQHEKDLREVFAAEEPGEEPKEADLVSKFLNHIEAAVGGIEQAADVAKGVKALIQLFKGAK